MKASGNSSKTENKILWSEHLFTTIWSGEVALETMMYDGRSCLDPQERKNDFNRWLTGPESRVVKALEENKVAPVPSGDRGLDCDEL